ncbi:MULTISPECIES: hypothetical protein [Corynebacterium]|uniref:hypothetical protein n=1 Tax=Corynebacterium TaxID=1716 RepID=UPI00254CDF55|nr:MULTISPECIES: hypothetical protein [Corynebacterium]MDK6259271.1 hypothetical protein [Corynebacterium frankenforstense]MDK8894493.1 hypothetical protein [Corynebacterium sp. MSK006]
MTDIHYTSWGPRHAGENAVLLVGKGPEELGSFGVEKAEVGGETWQLKADGAKGVLVRTGDGREFRADGAAGPKKQVAVDLAGKKLTLVNENSSNWVVLDPDGVKIAQFSGTNNGVRRSILEFSADEEEPEKARAAIDALTRDEVVALSFFTRTILEAKLSRTSGMVIVTLVAATILAVLTFLI